MTINIAHQIRFIIFQLGRKPVNLSIVGQRVAVLALEAVRSSMARGHHGCPSPPHLTLGPE